MFLEALWTGEILGPSKICDADVAVQSTSTRILVRNGLRDTSRWVSCAFHWPSILTQCSKITAPSTHAAEMRLGHPEPCKGAEIIQQHGKTSSPSIYQFAPSSNTSIHTLSPRMACYLRNGTKARRALPCNHTAIVEGHHTSCCEPNDLCLTNGLCRDPAVNELTNYAWFFGCTDPTFKDPSCGTYCDKFNSKCTAHDRFARY